MTKNTDKAKAHSPLPFRDAIKRATRAFDGDSNDEEHDALLALIESSEAVVNHADKLAEALGVASMYIYANHTLETNGHARRVYEKTVATLAEWETARKANQ